VIGGVGSYHLAMEPNDHDSVEQPTQATVPDDCGTHRPGDVIDLGFSELKDSRGNTTMTFHFEGVVAGGSVGALLGQAQAAAIRDVLTYLANKGAGDQQLTLEQE
jgi:hypothetical protein